MKLLKLLSLSLLFIFIMTQEINAAGLIILKKSESLALKPYICPSGRLTVGYGHTGNDVHGPITETQAEDLLKKDLSAAQNAIEANVKVHLTSNQFSALVSLVFNIGTSAFANSHLLLYLNQGRYQDAANQFDVWVHGNGKVLPGLVIRRHEEKQLFLS